MNSSYWQNVALPTKSCVTQCRLIVFVSGEEMQMSQQ
jgi:hypothetical protein